MTNVKIFFATFLGLPITLAVTGSLSQGVFGTPWPGMILGVLLVALSVIVFTAQKNQEQAARAAHLQALKAEVDRSAAEARMKQDIADRWNYIANLEEAARESGVELSTPYRILGDDYE